MARLSQAEYDRLKGVKEKGGSSVGVTQSILAGLGSGIFKIFEGGATLGATLLDLGVDKNRAEAVEAFFDDINPFDEMASATAAGKITELIVNLGIPGGAAFRIGSGLTKATLAAKEAGTYLGRAEKVKRFAKGAGAGGVAEGVFVGDVEDAGSFGDLLGGPTEIDRESKSPETELLNRLKFGLEGAVFTGALGGAGVGIKKLRSPKGTGKVIDDPLSRWIDKYISKPLRTRGAETPEGSANRMALEGAKASDAAKAERASTTIFNITEKLEKNFKQTLGDKALPKDYKKLSEELNEILMSNPNGKGLVPIFKQVDEIDVDILTGRPYEAGAKNGQFKNLKPGDPLPDSFTMIDPDTGLEVVKQTKTGEKIFDLKLQDMDIPRLNKFKKKLKDTYRASDEQIDQIVLNMNGMKLQTEKLLTSMGKRLTPDALEQFQKTLPGKINDIMDRGYDVFQKNAGIRRIAGLPIAENYAPTDIIIKETVREVQKLGALKGLTITDDMGKRIVDDMWQSAELSPGLKLNLESATVKTSVPDFVLKSVADEISDPKKLLTVDGAPLRTTAQLSEVTGVARPIIDKLLGKNKTIMSTLVEGTNNLSSFVRKNEYWDNMLKDSDRMKLDWDKWDQGFTKADGTVVPPRLEGAEPRPPMFVDDRGQARKYLNANKTGDVKMVGESISENSDGIKIVSGAQTVVGDLDNAARLKPLTVNEAINRANEEILNPLQGKFALSEVVDAITGVKQSVKGVPELLYQNAILYPKATAQMAKTILAPFTHARNFLSAAAFAGANGIMPFGNTKDVKAAWNALQVAGPGTRQSNEFYQELLELGVVNSNVQLEEVKRLLKDVDFGSTLNNVKGLQGFLKKLSGAKKFAQDAYTAEDDFWKIFTYLGEKGRMETAFKNAGLSLGQEFIDPKGITRRFNDQYLKEAAADLVKNNVPNYAYVSDFIKGLRKLPVGNFVAFPAEIMRTGTNIVQTALDEIFYTIKVNGQDVKPLASRGYQRLMGMGITTTALPLGTVAMMQTIYDVNKEELDSMRRYVADWSKNSVLVPFRDKDDNLEYIDFSHLNAYDTLTRPIQTVLNAVQEGKGDKDGIMDDFLLGLIESTKEIGSPFFTEAIWTKALQDVAPVLGRGGITSEGRKIWNQKDSTGDKMYKAVAHLVEAQAPFNWKQLGRLGLAMVPTNSEGKFDERGNEYELGNELLGIAGLRRVKVDPQKSFKYKINQFQKGIRDSRGLFTAATLKGGPVSPEEIVDAYINANRATFEVNRELYKDMEAAKILGMSEGNLEENMENRGAGTAFDSVNDGEFRPFSPSKNVQDLFDDLAVNLGIANPYDGAEEAIDRIQNVLEMTPLDGEFPDIINPLKNLGAPALPQLNTTGLPPLPDPMSNTGTQFGNISPVSGLTISEEMFLDPLEKRYTASKRKQTQPTKLG